MAPAEELEDCHEALKGGIVTARAAKMLREYVEKLRTLVFN